MRPTARRCRRTRPRSPTLSTTAAIRVRCNVFCAAGGPVRHATSSCRSRARFLASCTPPTVNGWHVKSHPRAAPASRSGSSRPIPTTGWPVASTAKTAGTAELIGWDGTQVAAILTGEDGVGRSCLIDPSDGTCTVLDCRSGGRLVDAWAGAALVRVGPRGYRELIMLRGQAEIALLPSDPGSTTDAGVILDDHHPRRLRART